MTDCQAVKAELILPDKLGSLIPNPFKARLVGEGAEMVPLNLSFGRQKTKADITLRSLWYFLDRFRTF